MNKLKAFTILEALISLVLSSIIIALTYSLFTLIGKQMALFQNGNIQVTDYNLFNTTLINDIEKARIYEFENETLQLTAYDDSTISYTIESPDIIRFNASGFTDTLAIRLIDYKIINKQKDRALQLRVQLLKDTITTYYFLKEDHSNTINNTIFNED